MVPQDAHPILVIGHKNPDTDSICAAIAYARLKSALDGARVYLPCRAGLVNRETEFVLDYFGVEPPLLCTDVSPQLRDADYRREPGVAPTTSLRQAWHTLRDRGTDTLCVVDGDQRLMGLVTAKDLAGTYLDLADEWVLARAGAEYRGVAETLEAQVAAGDLAGKTVRGRIVIGVGSQELMDASIAAGDVVILANRADAQLAAVEAGAACVVVCAGAQVSDGALAAAQARDCLILRTALSPYVAGQMIVQSAPIRASMRTQGLVCFTPNTPAETVRKRTAPLRHRYFPVVDEEGRCLGLLSRRNLLNLRSKQLILVDHNEKSQAVDGLEEAEVLEVVDHHRLGALETAGPVYFRNVPVGATCTVISQLYDEHDLVPDRATAGLMLSAILSDTLLFRSPTCTDDDRRAARRLVQLAGVEVEPFAQAMFDRGGDVTGKSPEEILRGDYKIFSSGPARFGVGHCSFMTEKNLDSARALLAPYLSAALAKQRLDYVLCMLTYIPTATTTLLMAGEGVQELVRRAFHVRVEGDAATLPGVVSRKKQVIPALLGAIRQPAGI